MTPVRSAPKAPALTREDQILAAAERLFFERSFDGVGVDEIGRAAGTSGSAIYRHFPNKDAILAALFDKILDTLLIRIGEPADDPHVDLDQLLRGFAGLVASHERLVAIWMREQRSLAQRYRDQHDRRHKRVAERWVDCLQRCYPRASTDELVTATRGVQLLLLSEAFRPPGGRAAPRAQELLVKLGLGALRELN
ncbi:helix-turn-helix domain containing protein [Mycobacterium sp. CVI_P3]|uniref:Helix-turn-helix domain containing protein n=1 Tax=Mycobacterium pinniadriaticum TaxID=2994102 RepID=A0ABT3S9Q6_9MYCO|nr:TetR/AcrR family transcriptional regulator [Mycobacterium pinniadriaticum]MCX2930111.1 helix-turn-helix domain containing protein [Mycobacterium pinniadriaticum]MCX2936240.1 helix-turn-helix domain containing protein [Mycobacterium pinniadriaticum]